MNWTFRQLEVFLAVARTLSFSQAARDVGISQPALSNAIRKLEDLVGARLFDRDTRNVMLTPVGHEMLRVAGRLSEDSDAAFESMRNYTGSRRGRLSVAASPSLAAGLLPRVIHEFEHLHPRIEVRVHDTLSESAIEALRDGTAEASLAPGTPDDPELDQRVLYSDDLVLVCRSDHPLAKLREVPWQRTQSYRIVTLKPTSAVRRLVEAAYAQQRMVLRPGFEVEQTSTVIGFVAHGLGIAVLPSSLIPLLRLRGITHRPLVQPAIRRAICVMTLRSRSLSPAATAFVRLCTEVVGGADTDLAARSRR